MNRSIIPTIILLCPIYGVFAQIEAGLTHLPFGLQAVEYHTSIDFGDFNGDGLLDIVLCRSADNKTQIQIAYNDPTNPNSLGRVISSPDYTYVVPEFQRNAYIAVGDLNGDTLPDIVITEQGGRQQTGSDPLNALFVMQSRTRILHNVGTHTEPQFVAVDDGIPNTFVGGVPSIVSVTDDGLPDIFISDIHGKVVIYKNLGEWTFELFASNPPGLDHFRSPVSFAQLDITSKTKLVAYSFEKGFEIFIADDRQFIVDTVLASSFYDPTPIGNIFYEIRIKDILGDGTPAAFLNAKSFGPQTGKYYSESWHFEKAIRCVNSTGVLQAEACASMVSPSGKYTWLESGTYLDTIPNANGCDSIISVKLTIVKVDTAVTKSEESLIAAASNADFQWLDCDQGFAPIVGETQRTFKPSVNGNYAVQIMQNGCADTSACIAFFIVGIDEKDFAASLRVYPNPSTGQLTLDLGKPYSNVRVRVRNLLGQLVRENIADRASVINLELGSLAGVYFIEIRTSNNHFAVLKVLRK